MSSQEDKRRRWKLVQELFHRARDLSPDQWSGFLRERCGEDSSLFDEVNGLLADALDDSIPGALLPRTAEDLSGKTLGNYELVRILGEGSMGVIYEARQRTIGRSVALKILRKRSDVLERGGSPEAYERMTRRFGAEAEVLGLLDHPGIVPIHEMEQNGERSYFTMRLVRGEDLRNIIERVAAGDEAWSLQRALGLVLRVCETMAFAHDRGVLHRDLKPSHVMVGSFGEVYIVDWGLAKLPGRPEERDLRLREEPQRAAVDTQLPAPLRTVEGDVIGTPAYMPPEQARGELGQLGPRSDVYAVGALLYHLLTGSVPYVAAHERGLSAQAVLERVKKGPPPPVQELAPSLAPALAAICDKAMARDPNKRYADMQALYADLRAFLENRVVTAHRTGALVELWKWLQRNRVVSLASLLVFLVGIGWAGSVLYLQAERNRELALAVEETKAERDRAWHETNYANATSNFLHDIFRSSYPMENQGEPVSLQQALDHAALKVDGAFPGLPRAEAAIRQNLGVSYHRMGHYESADVHLALAVEKYREALGEDDGKFAVALGEYASNLRELGRLDEAERLIRRSLALQEKHFGKTARTTLAALGNLCQVLQDKNDLDQLEIEAERLLALQLETGGEDNPDLPTTYSLLGALHYAREDLERAEHYYGLGLDHNLRHHEEEHSSVLMAKGNLMIVLDELGRPDEALVMGTEVVDGLTKVFGPRHPNTLSATGNLALQIIRSGDFEDGMGMLLDVLASREELFGVDHPSTNQTRYNVARILQDCGREDEALPFFADVVDYERRTREVGDWDRRVNLMGYADCLLKTRDFEGAAEAFAELLPLQRDHPLPTFSKAYDTAQRLAICYENLGRTAELSALREEMESYPRNP